MFTFTSAGQSLLAGAPRRLSCQAQCSGRLGSKVVGLQVPGVE